MRILKYRLNYAEELLCKCKYFRVERILINNISSKVSSQIDFAEEQISILLCTKGKVCLLCVDEEISLEKGKCIFVPSQAYNIFIEGYVELLKISC